MITRSAPGQPADPSAGSPVDLSKSPSTDFSGSLDALLLIRLVRRRRRLRRTLLLTMLALPVAALAAVIADSVASWDYDQYIRDRVDFVAAAGVGLLAAVFLLSVGWLTAQRLRRRRPEQIFAARIRPVFGRGGQVEAFGDRTHGAALVGVLDHRPRFGVGVALYFLGSVAFAIALAFQLGPVWNANHGHGGTPVTIGMNASLDHTEYGRHGKEYYLSTPDGVVISQAGAVHDGERLVVIGSGAYAVGGHTYLLIGALLVGAVGFAVVTGLILVTRWQLESSRRAALGNGHPGDALDSARAGGRIKLAVAAGRRGTGLPATPIEFGSLDATGLTGRQWFARAHRRAALVTGAPVAVAGLVVTAFAAGIIHVPVSQRPVTIEGLPADFGHPDATALYKDLLVDPKLYTDIVGRKPDAAWVVTVYDLPHDTYADLDLYRASSPADAAAADAKWAAFETGPNSVEPPTPLPVGVLPDGWSGAVHGPADTRTVDFVSSGGSYVLEGSVSGGLHTTRTQLTDVARSLLAALDHQGVAAFAQHTEA